MKWMPLQNVVLFLECLRYVWNLHKIRWRDSQKFQTENSLLWLQEERERLAKSETLAIRISNAANMVLFAAKVYASVRSGSLAIIASTLDSLLDLLSGFILWFTAFSMKTPNPYQYPIGKKRMQPLVRTLQLPTYGNHIEISLKMYFVQLCFKFVCMFCPLQLGCLCCWIFLNLVRLFIGICRDISN